MFRLASCLLVLLVSAAMFIQTRTAHSDVVAHWRFEEGSDGSTAEMILDSSENGRHGVPFGGPTYRVLDIPGSYLGLEFDGLRDRVHIEDHPVFELESLTLEAYIKIDTYPNDTYGQIVFRGDDRPGLDPWFLTILNTGHMQLAIVNGSNQGWGLNSPAPIPLKKLLHVAGTFDGDSGEQKLFVNGEEIASTTAPIRPLLTLTGLNPAIGIGNPQTDLLDQHFDGIIDEVRISDTALDPADLLPPPPDRITLDFEDHAGMTFGAGADIPESARLSDDYLETYGVVFESGNNNYVAVAELGVGHATSGANGIGSATSEDRLTYDAANPIIVSFFDPTDPSVPGVTDFVSCRGDLLSWPDQIVTLEAFDIHGNLLDVDSVFDSDGQLYSVSAAGIHFVKFTGPDVPLYGGGGVGLDDFTFNAIVPIPEPYTIILLLTGALGLLAYAWRRRRVA